MSTKRRPVVPVYMFHSIANDSRELPYGHLSTPVEAFARIAVYLYRCRFTTITLSDLYQYLSTGERLPPNPVVLTFDDGYLDNWVNAFPILAKYELKATIFVVPEFVDPRDCVRPTLGDVWKKKALLADLTVAGFLSWNEMKQMEASGLIDIQSHSLTHTCTFQSADIIDFHHPGDRYPWLSWNRYPECKYRWGCEDQEEFVEFGAPVYGYGRALAAPQYFSDESLARTSQEYVKQHGGREFFGARDWREQLFRVARAYTRHNTLKARYESEMEYEKRVREELGRSKEIIEKQLGKTVHVLCWPGGAVNETTQRIAQETGYLATTKGSSKNTSGADPGRINRIGGEIALIRSQQWAGNYITPLVFAAKIGAYRGDFLYSCLLRWSSRSVRAIRSLLGSISRRRSEA